MTVFGPSLVIIQVLCRKLEKAKDEKKRQIIIKHLKRLTAPTKGAAAVASQVIEYVKY